MASSDDGAPTSDEDNEEEQEPVVAAAASSASAKRKSPAAIARAKKIKANETYPFNRQHDLHLSDDEDLQYGKYPAKPHWKDPESKAKIPRAARGTRNPVTKTAIRVRSAPVLNNSSREDLERLMSRVSQTHGLSKVIFRDSVSDISVRELKQLQPRDGTVHSGRFWADLVRCEVPTRFMETSPRVHLSMTIAIPSSSKDSPKSNWRLYPYHAAYRLADQANIIPEEADEDNDISTAGKGSSADHLCGSVNCHRPSHTGWAKRHRDNTARIGCYGVLLTIYSGVILQETPCKHATDPSNVLSGCMRVRAHRLSVSSAEHIMLTVASDIAAAAVAEDKEN